MISAVLTAAGNSTRFGKDKLLEEIGGVPLIFKTIQQFLKAEVDEIVIATIKEKIELFEEKFKESFPKANIKIVEGGETRVHSSLNGVKAAAGGKIILHDGDRPLVPVKLIKNIMTELEKCDAVMTAVKPTATVKYVPDAETMLIEKSFPREKTWIAQTPQAFKKEIIEQAFQKAIDENYLVSTDDSELVGRIGHKVKVIEGHQCNIKITFPSEVLIAEKMCQEFKEEIENEE